MTTQGFEPDMPAPERADAKTVGAAETDDLVQAVGIASPSVAATAVGADRRRSSHETAQPAFDDHHPPAPDLIADCVHCGFCLPTCPTYLLFGEEMDSPRGRIYLMKEGVEGEPLNDAMVRHFDLCLGCMACVTACPSGVQYNKLIESTRQQVERRFDRSWSDRLFRELIFQLFPQPRRLKGATAPLALYQRLGIRTLLHRTGMLELLPDRLQAMEALMPDMPRQPEPIPEWTPAAGQQRLIVGLLLGCVQRVFFPHVNAATVRVLAAEGCGVATPPAQGCCGALSLHAGREAEAQAFARRTIDVFESAQVDVIAVNAAGCGSAMKEYGYLLRDDPCYAERARRFSARVRDVSELIVEAGPVAPRHPLDASVVYHDACHLAHAQGIRSQPRAVLAQIPGLTIKEVPREREICCGSAGIYNIVEPGPGGELGERKARNVLAAGGQILVAANPGCLLQIRKSLADMGVRMPIAHVVEILDASLRGDTDFAQRAP